MKKTERKSSERKVLRNVSKKSIKCDNLKVSETSPILNINDRNLKKSMISSNASKRSTVTRNSKSNNRKSSLPKIPKDAAVHFGNFYGLQEGTSDKNGDTSQVNRNIRNVDLRSSPKSEFTRQMVHKLERSAGTEDYARQVSALLEDTVEPANFRVNPLPSENSIPEGRENPTGYPLWYKDPYKMPITAKREYQLLKEKYKNISKKVQSETFVEETSSSENETNDVSYDKFEEEVERNTNEHLKSLSFDDSSSIDESIGESSVSYEPSDDEDSSSSMPSDKEKENENYETVDTVLPVR